VAGKAILHSQIKHSGTVGVATIFTDAFICKRDNSKTGGLIFVKFAIEVGRSRTRKEEHILESWG